ncbi:MAG: DUF3152 domain-containing protein [Winkia neuii]|nr:DUF3152 domain-containing protein [Winkia neuii]
MSEEVERRHSPQRRTPPAPYSGLRRSATLPKPKPTSHKAPPRPSRAPRAHSIPRFLPIAAVLTLVAGVGIGALAGNHSGAAQKRAASVNPPTTISKSVKKEAQDGPKMSLTPSDHLQGNKVPTGWNGKAIPASGTGAHPAVTGTIAGLSADRQITFSVEVEDGLPIDKQVAADSIFQILNDPRGWSQGGQVSFTRTDKNPQMRIVLGSPTLIDSICAPLDTDGEYSCNNGNFVALNAKRWTASADLWRNAGKSDDDYRIYLVSHEVGHFLGHGHDFECREDGLAKVMMQQTGGMVTQCTPNGWVNPTAKP